MNVFIVIFCILNSVILTYILTVRRVTKIERDKASMVINNVVEALRKTFPEVSIRETTISLKDNYPYDFESEEKFEQIVKDFDESGKNFKDFTWDKYDTPEQ